VVIGAGQAGLSASYHLQRRGIEHVVLDADDAPGGAWQHRWDSLSMRDVHGIAALPDSEAPVLAGARANEAVPAYFAAYERTHDLPVVRPVRVDEVTEDEDGLLVVRAGDRTWTTRTLVNATGTWSRPFVPRYPGAETFQGQQLQPTIARFSLPREPFVRLIECNRIDQWKHDYETWAEVEWYCDHSADPVGRLVLGLLRLADDEDLVRASDDVCTGLQLVNFLQDVPRDLELGRVYLPREDRKRFGVTELDRPNGPLTELLRFEAERARGLLGAGRRLQERIGGRIGRAVGLFARGGLAALDALEAAAWDVFTQRPRPSRLRLAREALRR